MIDSLSGTPGASVAGKPMAGVAIAVLRDALDLMEIQGAAVVTMINSAPRASDVVSAMLILPSDPSLGRRVNVLA